MHVVFSIYSVTCTLNLTFKVVKPSNSYVVTDHFKLELLYPQLTECSKYVYY